MTFVRKSIPWWDESYDIFIPHLRNDIIIKHSTVTTLYSDPKTVPYSALTFTIIVKSDKNPHSLALVGSALRKFRDSLLKHFASSRSIRQTGLVHGTEGAGQKFCWNIHCWGVNRALVQLSGKYSFECNPLNL